MSKQIIGALVGAVLLFIWQFLSWNMLGIHSAEMQYAANQDEVIEYLSTNLEPGHYVMPIPDPAAETIDQEAFMQKYSGKPWAQVSVHKEWNVNMGMNMARGFVIDFVAVFLLIWLIGKFENNDMMTSVMAAIGVGLIGYFTIPYLNHIWFKGPTMGYLIDSVASWGLVGAWLGWWLNR